MPGRRIADYLTLLDLAVLDDFGGLPFSQAGGQLLFHLISRLYEQTLIIVAAALSSSSNPSAITNPQATTHSVYHPPHQPNDT